MVSGFPAPQIGAPEIACSPESMLNELQKVAPKYRIEAPYTRDYQTGTGDESNILRMLDETMKERTKLILHLIEQRWDVFFAIFTCSDRVQHIFWRHLDRNHPAATPEGLQKYGSVIANFFHELDHALGLIMGKVDASTTTFVVSDHGHAAQVAHVGVNQLLAELGIVRYHRAYQFGLTTDTLIRLAASFGISVSLVKKLVPKKVLNKIPSGIDFSRSTAYCYRFGAINLNVKGRESLGIVDKERFEAERDNLARTLLDYVDPQTGMRLVEKILKPEEIYSGEQTSSAPDLLVIFRDGYGPRSWNPNGKPIQRIDSSEFDVTKPIIECGGHHWLSTVDGIFFVNGPTVRNDQSIDNAEIIDVAPTILHLLSLPIPKNMDGKVLSIFRPDSDPAIRPVEHGPDLQLGITERSAWTKEEEAEITRRLANLGYMG
jgi:predicted AlkP superfamily phosphohydrolase/phosphomutase